MLKSVIYQTAWSNIREDGDFNASSGKQNRYECVFDLADKAAFVFTDVVTGILVFPENFYFK
jgi:hypothetical protein